MQLLCWGFLYLKYNKAFKTDSQRSAFLVCFSFSVSGTMLLVQRSALLTT
ncbi:DUF3265 domain-containing protein [Vibrio parahaemolyticus]|nr:DUF3265 domain-containing protein [Vibrio parahaemolyticus]PMS56548.1 DUF3265 domain-containing protein [Vibrio parahaemolyticus]PMS65070.1 DUF3265 domain-containing protein [Vibrio parahaemolyticus]PMS70272.1 DUF3265 domain-containing protein [Vibrio parahaemolyticus]PMS72213.1 DUF3265 domain-containing protein [Vibrio parahaemolyticus]